MSTAGEGVGEGRDLGRWAGGYEWVEFVETSTGSDQTLVHQLWLDRPADSEATGSEAAELVGTFIQNGFQTGTEFGVVARPVDGGVAIEVVTVEGLTSLRPADVAFTLTGDPAHPLTTLGRLVPLQLDLPTTGAYFVPATGDSGSGPEPDPVAAPVGGYTRATGHAVVQFDGAGRTEFAAVDLATGAVGPVFHRGVLEASWFSAMELAPTGDAVYLTQGWEDYWYSCETSLPTMLRVDLRASTGSGRSDQPIEVGHGAEPRVSPDGTRLAYLTASDCIDDPENPGNWVLTPFDTIVVRDLATAAEVRHTVPGIIDEIEAGADYPLVELTGLVWLDDERLGTSGRDILAADDLAPTGDHLPVLIDPGSFGRTLGYAPSTDSVLVEVTDYTDDGALTFTVFDVDLESGGWSEVATIPGDGFSFGNPAALDTSGEHLLLAGDDQLILPDGRRIDLPGQPVSVGW